MDEVDLFLEGGPLQKLEEARKLNDEDSQNDPETDPFRSKYKAREIWSELCTVVQKECQDHPSNECWLFLLSGLQCKLGLNYVECEEVASGEELLIKCEKALVPYEFDKRVCSLYQHVLTQLGILWCTRRQFQTARDYLVRAESLYKNYKHEVGGAPYLMDEIFQIGKTDGDELEAKRLEGFEDAYTHTLYYLAQVYEKMEEREKAAKYCHITLHRQLDTLKYNPYDWALNAATLSQYYITQEDFHMARHCLASASVILKEVQDPGSQNAPREDESQAEIDQRERLPRAQADLNRCWAKYGLALLDYSWEKMVEAVENDRQLAALRNDDHNQDKSTGNMQGSDNDGASEGQSSSEGTQAGDEKSDLFFNLEVTHYEEKLTAQNVLTFDEARQIFLPVQKWLLESKGFYVLDGHCSDHVEIIQDHSRLFKTLALFEPDFDRQCKMHKRRADMLEETLKELNPQFYLLICRQMQFELAEIYSNMLDLKVALLEEASGTPSPHAVRKINQLTKQAITHYEQYIDTLRTAGNKELPSKFCDDDERPGLVAHFCTGRLYSKFIEPEVNKRILNMGISFQYYKFLVDYVKKNPQSEKVIKSEYEICTEMVTLLPLKMERVRAGLLT